MAVIVLWSAPRSRSTAFFRSMLQRGDLLALHEPLEGLEYIGPVEAAGQVFTDPEQLMAWLLDDGRRTDGADGPGAPGALDAAGRPQIFLKETVNGPVLDRVLADRRFLSEIRHTFLIRRPEEIAASWWAIEQDMRIQDTAVEALHHLHRAVLDAGGHEPVVVDSDDLVTRPEATMTAYCTAVGLPFLPEALRWEPGVRPEWSRTARWHEDASASSGFRPAGRPDRHRLAGSDQVVRFAARHRPFYQELLATKLDVTR